GEPDWCAPQIDGEPVSCALQIDGEPVCVTCVVRSRLMENQFVSPMMFGPD
ncbi:hypothetical protein RRG08_004715, partial [Elysia crispata]